MKLKKLLALAFLTIFPISSLASCGTSYDDVLTKIIETKTLEVATEATYSPFEYIDKNGSIVGFDVDIVNLIVKKIESIYDIDINVKWMDQSFDGLVGSLQTSKCDLVAAAMSVTEERSKKVTFTNSYFETSTTVIVKDSSSISSLDELKKLKCGAQLGTVQASYISDKDWNSSNMIINKVSDLTLALEANQIDALVVEKPVAITILSKYSDFKEVTSIDFDDTASFALATQKNNSSKFLDLMNEVIDEAKSDGTINSLYNEALTKASN